MILICVAFYLLYKSLTTEKHHRKHQDSNHYNVERELYYIISIGTSWIAFILWEVFELIYIAYSRPSGFIQSDPWDIVIDLWIDSLGALSICFLYDEFTENYLTRRNLNVCELLL